MRLLPPRLIIIGCCSSTRSQTRFQAAPSESPSSLWPRVKPACLKTSKVLDTRGRHVSKLFEPEEPTRRAQTQILRWPAALSLESNKFETWKTVLDISTDPYLLRKGQKLPDSKGVKRPRWSCSWMMLTCATKGCRALREPTVEQTALLAVTSLVSMSASHKEYVMRPTLWTSSIKDQISVWKVLLLVCLC